MKKGNLLAGLLAVVAFVGTLFALNPTVFTDLKATNAQFTNLYDNSGPTVRWFPGSRNIFNGALAFGDSATTSSITLPTTTTGSSFALQVPVYNPTASTIPQGTALISSNTGAGYVNVAPATIDVTNVIGVAAADITATSKGFMVSRGCGYAIVLTTGTVAVGDVLITSGTVAGRLGTDNTPTTGADVAVAMTAGSAGGSAILAIMR